VARHRLGFWYRFAVLVLKPLSNLFTRRTWQGQEHLRPPGGVIVAANHVSDVDPICLAHFLHDAGRPPRFMAKIEVFRVPFVGRVLRGCVQIPVERHSEDAAVSLTAAEDAVRRGECVVIYPEGTVTKDPDYWPMRARTGVARLQLATGAPVIPVAQWGAQVLMDQQKKPHLHLRVPVALVADDRVDLSRWAGQPASAAVLREITDAVMWRLREMVSDLRHEAPPPHVLDLRAGRAAWVEQASTAAAAGEPPVGSERAEPERGRG
jgi:1-acyl-sn-glycerol-3-phosphate acyltransferase